MSPRACLGTACTYTSLHHVPVLTTVACFRMASFNLITAIMIGNLSLGTFVSANLLNVNVFITCCLIIGAYVVMVPLVALFPRDGSTPKHTYNTDDASDEECQSLMSANDPATSVQPSDASSLLVADHDSAPEAYKTPTRPPVTMFDALLRAATVDLPLSIMLVVQTIRDPFTRPVMILYFIFTLAGCISLTTQQWASGTFHTGISNIDKVTAMEQIISAATLLALPVLARYFLRPRLRSKEAVDFCVMVGSMLTNIAGALIIAAAPSLAIYAGGVAVAATGIGIADALRSFATSSLSDKNLVERLYISIRTVQTLAAIVGAPLWSGSFVWLVSHPNLPRGSLYLEYAFLVFVCLVLALSLWRSRQPDKQHNPPQYHQRVTEE
jgi:hypothetical protein